jgi:sulfur-carrier protein
MLHGPLKARAGGRGDHAIEGATVRDVLRGLERAQPAVGGWILDERGLIREHVSVFVNGEHGGDDTPVEATDRIEIVQSISGG